MKERKAKAQELLQTIKVRRTEVKAKAATAQAAYQAESTNSSWGKADPYMSSSTSSTDPLDAQFRRWEADEELAQLKRNLGK